MHSFCYIEKNFLMESHFERHSGIDTPRISFNANTGLLYIEGKSFPPDAVAFYEPIIQWLKEYIKDPAFKTILRLKLDYFNTSSSKIILDILYLMEDLYKQGHDVKIEWYYPEDDEDMMETGEEYAQLIDVPFENISYKFTIN